MLYKSIVNNSNVKVFSYPFEVVIVLQSANGKFVARFCVFAGASFAKFSFLLLLNKSSVVMVCLPMAYSVEQQSTTIDSTL